MTDVFISYSSEDRDRVRPLVTTLERGGWSVWWDRQIDAGTAFDREIEKAIDEAKCIVVIWSKNSVESEWVRTEAGEGLERGNLVPVMIENVKLPLAFRRIQAIDFAGEDAFDQIRESVARFALPASQETSDQTPFVAREAEKARVEVMLDRIREKEGKTLIISGEAGVGKTRLTKELANIAAKKNYLVLTGHCLEMEGAPPYQPLLEQIAQVSRMFNPEVFRENLGDNAPEVAKLMPELRQQFSDIKASAELPPEQERRYLLNGVGDFIERGATPTPMVLIFEDLHWADDSTCILLRYLADRLKDCPVMIIGTYRDDDLDSASPFARILQELNRERLTQEVSLKRLGKEGVQQLIEGRARKTAPVELIDLVYTETEGNPFFVEEVFRHLEEEGKLFDENGEFMTGVEIADTEVPRGVRLIIVERLDRVSDLCNKVLTIAAVAGRKFSFDLMLSVNAKLDEDDVLDALEEAESARLIEDLSEGREAKYGFVHEQIRQTLLTNLSFPRRQRTHLRVATALEEMYGSKSAEYAGELSYHLYQAGSGADGDKTAHYLTLAGIRALSSLAFEDALRLIDSAMEVISESNVENLSKLFVTKAEALCGMGKIDDSLAAYTKAIELIDDELIRDDTILQRCRMLLDVWRGSESVEDLEMLLARK
ncbi:MAG: putative ATPase, partial [Kiritimatiellia bacterium]